MLLGSKPSLMTSPSSSSEYVRLPSSEQVCWCDSGADTYTKCFVSSSFHAAPPSFRALTLSMPSAAWSSTTKSTSWLRPDFADPEDVDSSRMRPLSTGARDFDVPPLCVRCLPCSMSFFISLSRLALFFRVGWMRLRFVDVVMISGSDPNHCSADGTWAVMTGYCSNISLTTHLVTYPGTYIPISKFEYFGA